MWCFTWAAARSQQLLFVVLAPGLWCFTTIRAATSNLPSFPNQHSSVPAALAPYPSVSKENIRTSRAWQPSNMYALCICSSNSNKSWRDACVKYPARRWGGRGLSIAIGSQENIFQWPLVDLNTASNAAPCQSLQVYTTELELSHITPWERRTDHQLHTEAASTWLTISFKTFFSYDQAKFWTFHPHIARFCQRSRGNRRQATMRMVEHDRSIEGRDSPLSELEQWTIAPVNFSVTWHVTSERVCWVK